jgi:hypothetical protein
MLRDRFPPAWSPPATRATVHREVLPVALAQPEEAMVARRRRQVPRHRSLRTLDSRFHHLPVALILALLDAASKGVGHEQKAERLVAEMMQLRVIDNVSLEPGEPGTGRQRHRHPTGPRHVTPATLSGTVRLDPASLSASGPRSRPDVTPIDRSATRYSCYAQRNGPGSGS